MMAKASLAAGLSLIVAGLATPAFADSYDDSINAQIRKNVEYPRLAKMRQQEGTVGFTVKIDGSGAVSDVSVDNSSGVPTLDNATVDAIKRSAPFPAPAGGPRAVHGVVAYKMG